MRMCSTFFLADNEVTHQRQQQQKQRRKLQTGVTADVVLSESAVSVAEGGADATYTVILSEDPGTTVNVDISTASSEITTSKNQLVFLTSNWSTAQPVTVSAVEDEDVESLVEVFVTHSVVIPNGSAWEGVFSPSGANLTARVYDNDEAGVVLSASTLYVDEAGSETYDVKLMGTPLRDVEVCSIILFCTVVLRFRGASFDEDVDIQHGFKDLSTWSV